MPKAIQRSRLAADQDPEASLGRLLGPAFTDYRLKFRAAEAGGRPSAPLHLDVDVTTACNFSCPMCPGGQTGQKFPGLTKGLFLDRDLYRRALAEAAAFGLPSLRLGLTGEPLLAEDIDEWVAEAKKAGVLDISLITNGALLTRERVRALMDAGLTRLMVSVDAAGPETYARVRPGGDWDALRENLAGFLEVRRAAASSLPLLRLSFVEMKINLAEREEFRELFAPLADYLSFQRYQNILGLPETDLGLYDSNEQAGFCPEPFTRLALYADGGLFPCCSDFGRRAPLGRFPQISLVSAWNAGRNLTEAGAVGRSPCRQCIASSYFTV
ncbi:MAG: radical SAM protein [Deltaproteobacteria bacterium]|nr:radical SAM protein [Deltaproteobacteria bacterium]